MQSALPLRDRVEILHCPHCDFTLYLYCADPHTDIEGGRALMVRHIKEFHC